MAKEVVVRPHILSNRNKRIADIDYGMTIQEIVDRVPDLDERLRQCNLAVLIDGVSIPRIEWPTRRVREEDKRIEVAAVLSGGGGNDKQILALVATVFLMAFAGPAAANLTSSTGLLAGSSYLMVKAGIVMVGTLAINAIFRPPVANNNGSDTSPTYSFTNQSNQARPFGRLPRIYGRHRFTPDVAAVPYTVNAGDENYIYVIYSFGYGPLELDQFRIGTNPLENYDDVEMRIHENFTDPSQLKIYRKDIWQDSYNFELLDGASVTVTTQLDTDRAILDISWPSGLGIVDQEDGDRIPRGSFTKLEYRATGSSGAWSPCAVSAVSRGRIAGNAKGRITAFVEMEFTGNLYNMDTYKQYGLPVGTSVIPVSFWEDGPPAAGTSIELFGDRSGFRIGDPGPNTYTVVAATATSVTISPPLRSTLTAANGSKIEFTYQSPTDPYNGEWRIEGHFPAGFSAGATIAFPNAGQWDIRVTKTDHDETDTTTNVMWRKYLTSLKSLKNKPPIDPAVPLTIVELKIRASGQLNGTIEQFSAVAYSKLRMWNGSAWVVAKTRNPAWIYLDVLQGTANARPLPDSRVDLDKLKEWAVRNDTVDAGFTEPLGTCDFVVDRPYTVWELLQSVATTGRATPGMRDNLYSVLIDDATRAPVQMFTPRNSRNLRSKRTYVKEPHALRVKWIDPQHDYEPAEIIVYNTGYTALTATEFEELQSFGMTRPEQVTRWGRYMLAQGKLRQERFTLETDLEHIVCLRGDKVLVAHDVIQVGGEACRIAAIDGDVVFLDAPPTTDTTQLASSVGIRVRKLNGEFTGVLNLLAYDEDSVQVQSAASLAGCSVGDLLVFGPKTAIVGEYVVDSITPNGELGATINLEEFASGVYDAEFTGVIPDYLPPGGGRAAAPPVTNLTADLLEYYDGIRPFARVKLSWRPSFDVSYSPEKFRLVQIAEDGAEIPFGDITATTFRSDPINLLNYGGQTHSFRVRADYGKRGLSSWEEVSVDFPLRATKPPTDVDNFVVTNLSAERRRYTWSWNAGTPPDTVGVQIRYMAGTIVSPVWEDMTSLNPDAPYFSASGMEINKPTGAGTYTFVCRAVDRFGILSVTGFRVVATLEITAAANDTTPPPTPTGFTATGGFGEVTFTSDSPSYTVGRGHGYTQVYGAVVGGVEPTFADAVPFVGFTGSRGVAGAPPATTYRFWAKWVSKDGGISVTPAGPVTGVTAIDIDATLDALAGQITETQLHTDLGARIDLIDGPDTLPGSVAARVKTETDERTAADSAMASDITSLAAKFQTRPNLLKNGGFEMGDLSYWTSGANVLLYTENLWGPSATLAAPPDGTGTFTSDSIPAQAGATYVIHGDSLLLAATGYCYFDMLFYDASDVQLLDGPQGIVNAPHDFATGDTNRAVHAVAAVAPAGAVSMRGRFVWTGTGITAVGCRQIKIERGELPYTQYTPEGGNLAISASVKNEATARASADSSLAIDITTLQSKVVTSPNLLPNGGFEMAGTGWTLNAISTGGVFELSGWGPCFYKSSPADGTGTLTSDFFPCQAGGEYTITGDTRILTNAGGTITDCYFDMLFYDASGTLLLNGAQNSKNIDHYFSTGNINRDAHVVTDTAPVGTTQMRVRFLWTGTNLQSAGCRQIKVERGNVATPYTQEVSLQVQSEVVSGLSGQFTVKIDANDYITGFGLASTPVDGVPSSTFAVRSDKFYIASPSGPGVAPSMPFVVYTTTQTINGASVPPGVYMRSAFIHNALITSAMIQNLDASKVNATSLSAITATVGTLRTASSGARMEIRDNVIKVYDSSNVLRVQIGDLTL